MHSLSMVQYFSESTQIWFKIIHTANSRHFFSKSRPVRDHVLYEITSREISFKGVIWRKKMAARWQEGDAIKIIIKKNRYFCTKDTSRTSEKHDYTQIRGVHDLTADKKDSLINGRRLNGLSLYYYLNFV